MRNWTLKHRDLMVYLFFGGCTTAINLAAYYIFAKLLLLPTVHSTTFAWFIAVIFAFFTNKIWVFQSKSWKIDAISKEMVSFFLCRVATGLLDLAIMEITVDIFQWNDMVMKIISNILVILLNFIFSKLVIFKEKIHYEEKE